MNVIPVDDRFVQQIRVAEPRGHHARRSRSCSAVDFVTSELENPSRLIIELRAHGTPAKLPSQPATHLRWFIRTTGVPASCSRSNRPAHRISVDRSSAVGASHVWPRNPACANTHSWSRSTSAVVAKAALAAVAVPAPETALPARRNSSGIAP